MTQEREHKWQRFLVRLSRAEGGRSPIRALADSSSSKDVMVAGKACRSMQVRGYAVVQGDHVEITSEGREVAEVEALRGRG